MASIVPRVWLDTANTLLLHHLSEEVVRTPPGELLPSLKKEPSRNRLQPVSGWDLSLPARRVTDAGSDGSSCGFNDIHEFSSSFRKGTEYP
jgi:hypothetical protein